MHGEVIYQFATTEDEVEAYGIMLLIIDYILQHYEQEFEAFAAENNINVEGYTDEEIKQEYSLYLMDLLMGMRERAQEHKNKLEADGLTATAFIIAMKTHVMEDYQRFEDTESGNAKQMAQLDAVSILQEQNSAVKVFKTWVAHPDCCDVCRALAGTTVPIDENFLVDGQIVELGGGEKFVYSYKNRGVAIAHPNDRCWIEFSIEF